MLTTNTSAIAQSYYDDQTCQQDADAQVAPLRDQANTQAIGSALLGAGLGATVGGAVGGGRGAGIGAASGAVVGTGGWSLTRKTRAICSSNIMPITPMHGVPQVFATTIRGASAS